MSDLALAIVTAITNMLGPAAGPLSGGLPVVLLIAGIAVALAVLPRMTGASASGVVSGSQNAGAHPLHDGDGNHED
jgi:hypothetical protein